MTCEKSEVINADTYAYGDRKSTIPKRIFKFSNEINYSNIVEENPYS